MKAIAFSVQQNEKESLVLTNGKKHDLTLISNSLNLDTVVYAKGKQAIIVSANDLLDCSMLEILKQMEITHIVTRSKDVGHIDIQSAMRLGFKVANVPEHEQVIDQVAAEIIQNLTFWELGGCVGKSCCCRRGCELDFKK